MVFDKIVEIQDKDQVRMCKKLQRAQKLFVKEIQNDIDKFGNIVYTSSIIPTVIKMQ